MQLNRKFFRGNGKVKVSGEIAAKDQGVVQGEESDDWRGGNWIMMKIFEYHLIINMENLEIPKFIYPITFDAFVDYQEHFE